MPNKISLIKHILFRDAPYLLLMALYDERETTFSSAIAKKVNVTYSHVVKIISIFEKENIVGFDKKGRIKKLTLTKKGQDIALYLKKASELMG